MYELAIIEKLQVKYKYDNDEDKKKGVNTEFLLLINQ